MTQNLDKQTNDSFPASYVIEVNVQNFMHEVIQASLQTPVLVYFTATWCGPCKQFAPLLEKVVYEAKGRLKLARIDVDKSPELAQQFRIQSVPMVYVFLKGQPVDGFSGAMQESQLKQLFSQYMTATPEEEDAKAMLASAKELLEAGNAEQALRYYHAVYEQEPSNIEALAGFASALLALGEIEKAEELLAIVPETDANNELVVSIRAKLLLAKTAPKPELIDELRELMAKEPANYQLRCDLAKALFASGNAEQAVAELLAIIAADKNWNEGAARQQLLTFFEALGFDNAIAAQGRRKLSAILFK